MPALFYRLSATQDPEERLEDACMWKAMHDTYGAGITLIPENGRLPKGGLAFGRTGRHENLSSFLDQQCDYAHDPGFLAGISRSFRVCDLQSAEQEVKRLHDAGKGAFIKAVDQKLMTAVAPRGTSLHEAIGDMVYSFIDRPDCLMVQEFVTMRNERRFVVIDGQIITNSPVAIHLTPLDRDRLQQQTGYPVDELHFETPQGREPRHDPVLSSKMENYVAMVAEKSDMRHMIVDVAELENGHIEVIEFNACQAGKFGLYACDPYAIAVASRAFLPADLAAEVARRKADNTPAPTTLDGDDPGDGYDDEPLLDEDIWFDGP